MSATTTPLLREQNLKVPVDLTSGSIALHTPTFSQGWDGSGLKSYYNPTLGKTVVEVDNLIVRNTMEVFELLISKIRAQNGSVFVTDSGKISDIPTNNAGTWTIPLSDEFGVNFAPGDLIKAQQFNGTNYYSMEATVSAIGVDSITATLNTGSADPMVGMDLVRVGSSTDAGRRGSLFMTSTPYPRIDVLNDVASFADWSNSAKLKVRIGDLTDSPALSDGTAVSGYGLYAKGSVFLEGTVVANSGMFGDGTNGWSISAGIITATGTGVIKTSSTTTRMELSSTGLRAYNNNTQRVQILSDGSGWFGASNAFSWTNAGAVTIGTSVTVNGNISGASGSFTGTLYVGSSGIVLDGVNKLIKSSNYSTGSAGWQIKNDGTAELNDVTVRGTVYATAGTFSGSLSGATITGATGTFSGALSGSTITGGTIAIGSSNSIFKADTNGIYLGHATFASAPFRVNMSGQMISNSAIIGGWSVDSQLIYSGANIALDSSTNGGQLNIGSGKIQLYNGVGGGVIQFSDHTSKIIFGTIELRKETTLNYLQISSSVGLLVGDSPSSSFAGLLSSGSLQLQNSSSHQATLSVSAANTFSLVNLSATSITATTFTGALTGNASSASSVAWSGVTGKPDPVITLTGAVTGSGTMTDLGSVSIATTATADPTLTLAGDASGSCTFTNLGNATLTVTVLDDSHNHTSITGYANNVRSGEITNTATAWTAPGTAINNGLYVHRYQSTVTGAPTTPPDNANWLINIYSHATGGVGTYGHQITAFNNENIYFRSVSNGSYGTWRQFVHAGNFTSFTPGSHNHSAADLTSGTIAAGARLGSGTSGFLKYAAGTPTWSSVTKSDVGLSNVENTALSTWAGSVNITTIGTLTAGTVPWERISGAPGEFTPIAHSLGSHSDVTITSIASGEILKWSGTAWINNTLAEAGIAAASHTHTKSQITDFPTTWAWASLTGVPSTFAPSAHTLDSHSNVTITSNSNGEILRWNGTAWVNNTLAEAGIQPAGSYLTGNQTITLSGDATGSGATAITVTLANSGVTANTYGGNNSIPSLTVDAKGRITSATTVTPSGTWAISISGSSASCTGNANTATTLATSRNINGVGFNGSGNINVPNLLDTNGTTTIATTGVTSGVNYLTVTNAIIGSPVLLSTAGSDTNIGLTISTKGTGAIILDTGTGAGQIDLKPGSSNVRIWDDNSTHYYQFVTGDRTSNYNINLPAGDVTLVTGTMVPTTGTGATGSWGISITGSSASCTGNASTATTLQTARTINGTSFNGSANITTASWGTSRTLTLGGDLSGSVAIDGSANFTLTATVLDDSHTHTIRKENTVLGVALTAGTSLTIPNGRTYTIGANRLMVFVSGILQEVGATEDYIEYSTSTVRFNYDLPAGTKVTFYIFV